MVSIIYLSVVLLISIIAYYRSNTQMQNIILVGISSTFLMMVSEVICMLLLLVFLTDFLIVQGYQKKKLKNKKYRHFLLLKIFLNVLFLVIVKQNFELIDNIIVSKFFLFTNRLSMISTLGISFVLLQSVGYLLNAFWGIFDEEKDVFQTFLYYFYFPKILCGPIELSHKFMPQLKSKRVFSITDFQIGFFQILKGICKKIIFANKISIMTAPLFDSTHEFGSLSTVLILYLFFIQVYLDFSGYADIAEGISKIFSIKITKGFENPFSAISLQEFWSRWNISLYNWIRTYVFLPLKFSQVPTSITIFACFMVSAMWHYISINFAIWGLYHIIFIFIEIYLLSKIKILNNKWIGRIFVFNVMSFEGIFFRSPTTARTLEILSFLKNVSWVNIESIGNSITSRQLLITPGWAPDAVGSSVFNFILVAILLAVYKIYVFKNKSDLFEDISRAKLVPKLIFTSLVVFLLSTMGVIYDEPFIYSSF